MRPLSKARNFARALVTRRLDFEFEYLPYRLYDVTSEKLITLAHTHLNCVRPAPGAPWYPVQMQIEPSTSCTLKCPLCPVGSNSTDKSQGAMPLEMFTSLMDDVGRHATMAVFWMWGEPFTHRRLPEMVACAKKMNLGTVTSTNGQHLQTRAEAEELVASGLDHIFVAMDGATQETYGRYRVGGEIDKILNCIDLLCRAKKSLGSSSPGINVRTVVNRHNEHELGEIEAIARRLGANTVSRKRVASLDYRETDSDRAFNPEEKRYHRQKVDQSRSFKCRRPWNRMTVCSDGTVLSCEFDYERIAPFGQGGNGISFRESWRSEAASKFRRNFIRDMNAYPFCAECPYGGRSPSECTVDVKRLSA